MNDEQYAIYEMHRILQTFVHNYEGHSLFDLTSAVYNMTYLIYHFINHEGVENLPLTSLMYHSVLQKIIDSNSSKRTKI